MVSLLNFQFNRTNIAFLGKSIPIVGTKNSKLVYPNVVEKRSKYSVCGPLGVTEEFTPFPSLDSVIYDHWL